MEKKIDSRISAKDFISLGLFVVLYFIICMAVGALGFIPIFIPLLAALCPLFGGIPFVLYLTRVNKFGLITLFGVLTGLLMMLFGMGVVVLFTGLLFGFFADLVARSGGYKNIKRSIVTNGVFSMWVIGNLLPITMNRASYADNLRSLGYGDVYVITLMNYMPGWIIPVLLAVSFLCGLLGGAIGTYYLKRHFARAGMV